MRVCRKLERLKMLDLGGDYKCVPAKMANFTDAKATGERNVIGTMAEKYHALSIKRTS